MVTQLNIQGKDISMTKLIPIKERKINFKTNRGFHKILSSIMTIGLIEPLCVYHENDDYIILDGYLRFKACEHLEVKEVPCLLFENKEAYTYNRMVNKLSAFQESRMIRESLKKIDKNTIAEVFGIKSISHRLGTEMNKHLHKDVIKVMDKDLMGRNCALELTHVSHCRQIEILNEMKKSHDYSVSLARALVIKTPPEQRNPDKKHNKMKPWKLNTAKKEELVSKLEEVGKRYDFYINLYRQYSTDLLKLCIYIRKLITNPEIKNHLENNHVEILKYFNDIVYEDKTRKAM